MARPAMARDIERRIKELIIERGLAPGDPLPTEAELMRLFGAGRVFCPRGAQSLAGHGGGRDPPRVRNLRRIRLRGPPARSNRLPLPGACRVRAGET